MNTHWPHPLLEEAPAAARGLRHDGHFELAFARHGARTHIGRQFVSYPFHMTRPFTLDAAIPTLLTVYQQSSSGGLYRDENLTSKFEIGPDAAAHVTTQAATVVHHCHGQPARQTCTIDLAENAFFALTPDPLVLFPNAAAQSTITATLAPGSVLLISDAFACHDPEARLRPFDRLMSDVSVSDDAGKLLVRDRLSIEGSALAGPASPIGAWRVVANFMLLGPAARLPARNLLADLCQSPKAVAGISELPNKAGWGIRCLAADAVSARAVAEKLFVLSVEAAFGATPAPRRK